MNVELSAPVRPGLGVSPFEDGAVGCVDEIAAHREPEAAGGRHPVYGGNERFRRPTDLGDRRVEILEDLLEPFPVTGGRLPCGRTQIPEVVRVTAGTDVLEIGAAAEHAVDTR